MRFVTYIVIALTLASLALVLTGHQNSIFAAMDGAGAVIMFIVKFYGVLFLLLTGIILMIAA